MKIQHKSFDKLVQYSNAKNHQGLHMPIMLTGPAGSSKSQAAEHLAEHLGLRYGYMAGSQQLTKSDMLGYRSPTGDTVDSLLGEFYRDGGLFVIEELDAINSNILLNLNTLIAGSSGWFAGRMVKRHPDFRILATANTYGGSNEAYNARTKLDASTMSRFLRLDWGLDEDLEASLLNQPELSDVIKTARKEMAIRGFELSMRDVLSYQSLLHIGIPYEEAAESTVLREVDASQRAEFIKTLFIKEPSKEPLTLNI